MKIVSVLENSISAGGGFNQALNSIFQMNRLSMSRFDYFVLTSIQENIEILKQFGVPCGLYSYSILDGVVAGLSSNEYTRRLQEKIRIISPFEKHLIDLKCDLVHFVTPSSRVACLQLLNFIITVWDNCHRDFPEFPEVRNFGEFSRREFIYDNYLIRAFMVFVDSQELKNKLHERYQVDLSRMVIMPFAPNPLLNIDAEDVATSVLERFDIHDSYLLYPAQFWAHKNHIRIVEMLARLRDEGLAVTVVFVGGDKGNRVVVENAIKKLELTEQVKILGFVSNEDMRELYLGCKAVIMPTYFGPTNIPPMEAWLFGKPLIYSKHLSSFVEGAALFVDPDSIDELVDAVRDLSIVEIIEPTMVQGAKRLLELNEARELAEQVVLTMFRKFDARLRCSKGLM